MSLSEPPLASEAANTPEKAAFALRGSSFSATLPLYSGFIRSLQSAGTCLTTSRFAPKPITPQ